MNLSGNCANSTETEREHCSNAAKGYPKLFMRVMNLWRSRCLISTIWTSQSLGTSSLHYGWRRGKSEGTTSIALFPCKVRKMCPKLWTFYSKVAITIILGSIFFLHQFENFWSYARQRKDFWSFTTGPSCSSLFGMTGFAITLSLAFVFFILSSFLFLSSFLPLSTMAYLWTYFCSSLIFFFMLLLRALSAGAVSKLCS